ncbi:MAG TPA: redoxin domain-containing protein [Thermoanaerobaculia bacterium]|nr:redoxin domain-containing protein [Thermoanaerobaculia bacterium]
MKPLPALLLPLLLWALPGAAELTPGTPAPDFPPTTLWIGAGGGPLSLARLRGKVVQIDFWEYTCINCIRTFPHLKAWHQRYHDLGLEIVGVHKGEFAFASQARSRSWSPAPVPEALRGKDLHMTPKGETALTIDEPRMYYLVAGEEAGTHELVLAPSAKGARICSFTFGNRCQLDFDRL